MLALVLWPQRVDCFPANSVTIYLPAGCSFLFALSDTFHYGRCCPSCPTSPPPHLPAPTFPLMSCPCCLQRRRQRLLLCIVHAISSWRGRGRTSEAVGDWWQRGVAFSSLWEWHFRMQFLHWPPSSSLLCDRRSSSFFLHSFNFFCFQRFFPLFCIPVAKCIQFNASFSFRFRSLFIFVWLFFNEPPCWLKVPAYKNFQVCHWRGSFEFRVSRFFLVRSRLS